MRKTEYSFFHKHEIKVFSVEALVGFFPRVVMDQLKDGKRLLRKARFTCTHIATQQQAQGHVP